MGLVYRKQIPGKADVNETFSEQHIHGTKKLYEKLVKAGEYRFGDLTASFCGLSEKEKPLWEKEVAEFYPVNIQNEIIRVIEGALFYRNDKGADAPAPLEFRWNGKLDGLTQGIRATYDPAGPSYLIEIMGYPSPMGSLLSARRAGTAPEE